MKQEYSYVTKLAIAFDQFINTLLGGDPDETISARLFRKRHLFWWGIAHGLVNIMFFWQWRPELGGHCRQSWKSEMERLQLPEEYRKK